MVLLWVCKLIYICIFHFLLHVLYCHNGNSKNLICVFFSISGVHTRPAEFARNLREMRRQGLAGEFVSVSLHEGQRAVHIATDGGRVCRPLIIVDESSGFPKLTQKHLEALALHVITIRDLLQQGVVEYVDCNEGMLLQIMCLLVVSITTDSSVVHCFGRK
jgi:DNA-directed RNA polymerase beta subunit